jgi:predicted DCC family thiol-disulfide oxidoreductase YuxK
LPPDQPLTLVAQISSLTLEINATDLRCSHVSDCFTVANAHAMTKPLDVEIFFDGECPLCTREVALLRRRDRRARILFTDIAAHDFDASTLGVTQQDLMARIHGRLPDGTLIEGVEVFRRAYSAIGLGPLVSMTRLPGVHQLLDAAYRLFARNRLRLTGRCAAGHCELPHSAGPNGQSP